MYVRLGSDVWYWGHRQKGVRSKRNYFNEHKKCCTTQNSFKVMLLPLSARVHGGARLAEQVLARHRCLSWHLRAHTTITEISEVPRLQSHASRAGQVMEGRISTSTMESWLMLAREASSRPTPAPHPVFLAHLLLAQVHTTFRLRVAVQIVFE